MSDSWSKIRRWWVLIQAVQFLYTRLVKVDGLSLAISSNGRSENHPTLQPRGTSATGQPQSDRPLG